jgi:hypothetical protein
MLQVDVQQVLRSMADTGHGCELEAGPGLTLDHEHATHSPHLFSPTEKWLPYPPSFPDAHQSVDCGHLGSFGTAMVHHWYGDQSDPYAEWTEGLEVCPLSRTSYNMFVAAFEIAAGSTI